MKDEARDRSFSLPTPPCTVYPAGARRIDGLAAMPAALACDAIQARLTRRLSVKPDVYAPDGLDPAVDELTTLITIVHAPVLAVLSAISFCLSRLMSATSRSLRRTLTGSGVHIGLERARLHPSSSQRASSTCSGDGAPRCALLS
jgi:hypothetical protein